MLLYCAVYFTVRLVNEANVRFRLPVHVNRGGKITGNFLIVTHTPQHNLMVARVLTRHRGFTTRGRSVVGTHAHHWFWYVQYVRTTWSSYFTNEGTDGGWLQFTNSIISINDAETRNCMIVVQIPTILTCMQAIESNGQLSSIIIHTYNIYTVYKE